MKISINREELVKLLSHLQSIVDKRHTIPILANVKIEAMSTSGDIKFFSTDLDISITEKIHGVVHQTGKTTVAIHMLFEIIKKLQDNLVELELKSNNEFVITTNSSTFSLPTISPEDFPNIDYKQNVCEFSIRSSDFASLLNKTKHAISINESRYYLHGIYLHVIDEDNKMMLRAVATDIHRLALAQIDAPEQSYNMPGIVIPKKAVNEIIKLLDSDNDVYVGISSSKIVIKFDNIEFVSKLIDCKYPSYSKAIPNGIRKSVVMALDDFERTVDLVSTVAIDLKNSKTIQIKINENCIDVYASNLMNGNSHGIKTLSAICTGGGEVIGFNSKYLLDALSAINGDNLCMEYGFEHGGKAAIFRQKDDENFMCILMPMDL